LCTQNQLIVYNAKVRKGAKAKVTESSRQYQSEVFQSEERLSIRASLIQKDTIMRAAKAQHMNLSQFVLQASVQAAESILANESLIVVSPEQYDAISQLLDAPVQPMNRMRKAMSEKMTWDD